MQLGGEAADRGETYLPIVDGWSLPDDPARLFAQGKFHHAALIAGTNAGEGTLLGGPPVHNLAALRKWAGQQFPQRADAMLAVYPAATDAEAYDAATHASGDFLFLQGTRSVLRAAAKENPNCYQYQFTRLNGIGRKIKWGVFHASELPYVFGTLADSAYGTTPTLFGDFSRLLQRAGYRVVQGHERGLGALCQDRRSERAGPGGLPRFSDGKESFWSSVTRSPPRPLCGKSRSIS